MKKNKLTDNLFLRILAVIVAVLVWIIVVNVSDPIIESTYSGVPVEILNGDLISKQNETYEILNGSNTISVTITAKRSINDLLGKENIKATADMQELDEENGTIRIRLETNKYNDKIESIKSKTDVVEVEIEALSKRQFSITPVINGEPVEGYITGDVTLDQNVVTVQGPESVVSKIAYASVEASVAGMSGSISTTAVIRYYDEENNQVDASRLTGNINTVSIKVELLATKSLPLKFATTGTPADDYGLSGEITSDIEEVLVAGKLNTLVGLANISIPASAIDVEDKKESFTVTIDLNKYLPDNVRLADEDFDGKITVTVGIAPMETKIVAIPRSRFMITGLSDENQRAGLTETEDTIAVTFKGMPADLEKLETEGLIGTVAIGDYMEKRNMTTIKEGVYDIPVSFELPEGVFMADEDFTVECRIRNIK